MSIPALTTTIVATETVPLTLPILDGMCKFLLNKTKAVVGREWRLTPDRLFWIYWFAITVLDQEFPMDAWFGHMKLM